MMMSRKQFEEILIAAAIRMNLDLVGVDRAYCNHNGISLDELERYPGYYFGKNGKWIGVKLHTQSYEQFIFLEWLSQYIEIKISLENKKTLELLKKHILNSFFILLSDEQFGWYDDLHFIYIIKSLRINYLYRADVLCDECSAKRKPPDEDQERLFPVAKLTDYYQVLPKKEVVTLSLSRNEMAAILQAYDYGVGHCDDDGKQHLDRAITKIRNQIYPQWGLSS